MQIRDMGKQVLSGKNDKHVKLEKGQTLQIQ